MSLGNFDHCIFNVENSQFQREIWPVVITFVTIL